MRRVCLTFMVVAALAGCSSGTSNLPDSTTATSPGVALTPTADSRPIGFCLALKELESAKTTNDPLARAVAVQESAALMRKWAPPDIKDAAGAYTDAIDNIGKAAQDGTMDEAALQKAFADGLAQHAADVAKVAIWASTHCQL
jgi:hypothetical protein